MSMLSKSELAAHVDAVRALLTQAQADGVPVHVGTSRSSAVNVGFMVHTADSGDGRCRLVATHGGTPFTPRLTEIALLVTIDGRCLSRPSRRAPGERRRDVAIALAGLAGLLAEPDCDPSERARLEELVAAVAQLSA